VFGLCVCCHDYGNCLLKETIPWLRQLVVSLSLWRPRFSPVAVRVGFVLDIVALGQEFLQVLWFSPHCHHTFVLHTHISLSTIDVM
jgi:hypothetical protein